ncbi:PTS system mannose/fructose/sorbose family transporter subunit IID [Enterococcus saccharolyticus]|uniref:PTS system mannose/fructose/sorbose family transporter subunit IID n=1 Tax=Enterococcus saccharolyticus TaxID=41997 RepID=UPI001E58E2B4|nr:PTS system mannose/fructose/sorbose family transporter subunit IID [Enterococcus saccharolyticus]MCD5002372.1 PTS system mannose/fructose/sorbose family transporter subunit IID [Enterococcus saccharolyticus]
MKNEKKLTKKDISKASLRWLFFHQSSHNYERMMGTGFAHSLSGSLEKLYKDNPEGLKESLKRNLTFFNTEPQLGAIIPGISLALEETYASDEEFDPEIIASTKNALMGPVAGIGDSILVGTLNPILLSIGIGLSAGGSAIDPLFFLIMWLLIVVPLKYWLFLKGYSLGLDAVKMLTNERIKVMITTALTMVGLIVIGGVAATTIQAPIIFQYVSGEMTINLQEIFDRIMPNLMPLIIALVSYYLVDKKGWTTNKLLFGILAFAAVMVTLGIM